MHVSTIRLATEADLQRLVDVEVEAGQLFHAVGMSEVAEDVPRIADLREAVAAERVWVTCVGAEVAGYISAEVIDGNAHVAQVSVAPDYAGRGIGRAMIEFVEAWGRTAGCAATTLTTFRDVPWNAPYYLRLGYEVLPDNRIGPELARTMEHEASLPGIEASLRCAMIKPNGAADSWPCAMAPRVGPLVRAAVVLSLATSVALAGCAPEARAPTPDLRTPPSSPEPSDRPSVDTAETEAPTPPLPTVEPSPSTSPTPSAIASPPSTSADPDISRIGDRQWARIEATGTWRPECPVGRDDLRRLDVNYVDFDGIVQRGRLIAHRDSIDDLAAIFTGLFEAGFPIERMDPVEEYDGDVVRSLEANNTSAFNCRRPDQINAPVTNSPHANGRAIDINPYQNPWTDPRCDCWVPSADFATERRGPGVITEGSVPWQLFTERGWIWQNIKVPDYMHFDTGYPSRPR